jgi:hypothetical protein
MRICSLLPSATEIVASLGLVESLVAVSDACDLPRPRRGKPERPAPTVGLSGALRYGRNLPGKLAMMPLLSMSAISSACSWTLS